MKVGATCFFFVRLGDGLSRSLSCCGRWRTCRFHVSLAGEVDYLEVRPAPNGAAADRFSPFTNWTIELSARPGASAFGSLRRRYWIAGRPARRGSRTIQRAIDLEIVGTNGTRQVLGGRIRSALGLREQLFVIEHKYDDSGNITGFTILGRGWGHGVGMCQVGAYGLAKQGFTYDQILEAYYTGIELTRMY